MASRKKPGKSPQAKTPKAPLKVDSSDDSGAPVGRCLYVVGGVQKCANVTQDWCTNQLHGQWDPNEVCPT
jgi:hypothetical protein